MNILLNLSNLKIGGGLQVAHSFINEIKNRTDNNFIIMHSSAFKNILETELFGDNFKFLKYDKSINLLSVLFGIDFYLDKIVKDEKIDVVFTIFGSSYWKPSVRHISGFAKSQYIYFDSPFYDNITTKERVVLFLKQKLHFISFKYFVDVIITETVDVTNKLKKELPQKNIYTVTNSFNQIFDSPNLWDNSIKLKPFEGVTLLTISANYPHKNLDIIPKVISYLLKYRPNFKFRFVLTLDNTYLKNIDPLIKEHIVTLGKVAINQCPSLYKQADFLFLPTLLESFSASYPEAMKSNKPILTSDLSFARNICGDSAIYFNPMSPANIGDSIYNLSVSKEKQNNLIKLGTMQLKNFDSPSSRAEKYMEIITNCNK